MSETLLDLYAWELRLRRHIRRVRQIYEGDVTWSVRQLDAALRVREGDSIEGADGEWSAPKRLWMYWHQGEAEAPPLVKFCIESWRTHHPDWDVRVLDHAALADGDYCDLAAIPEGISIQALADVVRLSILARLGGVWADATTLCLAPTEQWLSLGVDARFFAPRQPGPDRIISNWLLVARTDSAFIARWHDLVQRWIHRRDPFVYYFWTHYIARLVLRVSPDARAEYAAMPRHAAPMFMWLQRYVAEVYDREPSHGELLRLAPVQKLDRRFSNAQFDRVRRWHDAVPT